jgi:hypothetical protein
MALRSYEVPHHTPPPGKRPPALLATGRYRGEQPLRKPAARFTVCREIPGAHSAAGLAGRSVPLLVGSTPLPSVRSYCSVGSLLLARPKPFNLTSAFPSFAS